MTINKERVELLVAALRSGEFDQGEGQLRDSRDNYCCLGVACEVARREGIGLDWSTRDHGGWVFHSLYGALTCTVNDWYGFPAQIGRRVTYNPPLTDNITMISANDELGMTFAEIAALLEARYLTEGK